MEELLKELKEINIAKNNLADKEAKLKKELEENYIDEEGYKCDFITISYTKPSKSVSVDLKALEKKEPELYEDLLKDYEKVTERKGSYRYIFK